MPQLPEELEPLISLLPGTTPCLEMTRVGGLKNLFGVADARW
jgi:hypothetical protein